MNYIKLYWIVVLILSLSVVLFPIDYFRSIFVSEDSVILEKDSVRSL